MDRINKMIQYTNDEIKRWYKEASLSYGVRGAGNAHYNKQNNEVVVEYVENGVQQTWRMAYYPEYINEHNISWVFNCWAELA